MVNHRVFLFFLLLSGHRYSKNLALNKPAYQISTYGVADASRAVDGSKDAIYIMQSCTHTRFEMSPWWMVDLGESYNIGYVTVTNRAYAGKCYVIVRMLSITT